MKEEIQIMLANTEGDINYLLATLDGFDDITEEFTARLEAVYHRTGELMNLLRNSQSKDWDLNKVYVIFANLARIENKLKSEYNKTDSEIKSMNKFNNVLSSYR